MEARLNRHCHFVELMVLVFLGAASAAAAQVHAPDAGVPPSPPSAADLLHELNLLRADPPAYAAHLMQWPLA